MEQGLSWSSGEGGPDLIALGCVVLLLLWELKTDAGACCVWFYYTLRLI